MFDFHIDDGEQATALSYFLFICLYLFIVLKYRCLMRPANTVTARQLKRKHNILLFLGLFVLVIAAVTRGDFYAYGYTVQNFVVGQWEDMEVLYYWLILVVNRNYLLWRIILWGGGLVLYGFTAKRLGVNVTYACFFLLLFYVHLFNYARASIAFVVYVFGLSFLLKPLKKAMISYMIGIAIIYCSHFFHSTTYLLMLLTPIIFMPINKWTVWFLIIAAPVIAQLSFSLFLNSESIALSLGDDMLSGKLNNYMTTVDSNFRRGLSGFLYHALQYSSMLVPMIIIVMIVIRDKYGFDFAIKGLMKMVLSITILAVCFLVVTDLPVFFYRTLNMLIVFIPLLFAYLHQNGEISLKYERLCYIIGISSIIYEASYGIYLKV